MNSKNTGIPKNNEKTMSKFVTTKYLHFVSIKESLVQLLMKIKFPKTYFPELNFKSG